MSRVPRANAVAPRLDLEFAMPFASSLTLLALLSLGNGPAEVPRVMDVRIVGADPRTAENQAAYMLSYVTVSDSNWRGRHDPGLTPLGRQGNAVVWAVDGATLHDLIADWQSNARANILQAPKVTTPLNGVAEYRDVIEHRYVAHLERVADGPVNQATRLAFHPKVDVIQEGVQARLGQARLESEGLRTQVAIEADRLVEIQTATYSESVVRDARTAEPSRKDGVERTQLNSQVQIPVVDSTRVNGEWVIPKGGALVVSLRPSRVQGKLIREVRPEEILVIQYEPVLSTNRAAKAERPTVRGN